MTPTEKYEKAVSRYLAELRATGRSPRTISNYGKRLRYFGDFWTGTQPDADPCKDDVRAWRDSLLDKGTAPGTVRQYLIELHTFFEFCEEDEIYDLDPVTKRLYPKTKTDSKEYSLILESEQLARLWENTGTGRKWARDYAIIVLLLDGKLRNAELLDARVEDVDFAHKEITIPKGKGDKRRTVTLTDISLAAMEIYLKSGGHPAGCAAAGRLFPTRWGGDWRRGTTTWLSGLVERHVRKVTGISGLRSHSLRHNGTVLDLNSGIPMERLQAELGHASVTTTEIYAGRLGSRRRQEEYRMALVARDYWASKNKMILKEMAK